jgi:hypothetical protein
MAGHLRIRMFRCNVTPEEVFKMVSGEPESAVSDTLLPSSMEEYDTK